MPHLDLLAKLYGEVDQFIVQRVVIIIVRPDSSRRIGDAGDANRLGASSRRRARLPRRSSKEIDADSRLTAGFRRSAGWGATRRSTCSFASSAPRVTWPGGGRP